VKYHPLLVYAHILLMVFWLGTDVGVFVSGLFFIDARQSLERRRAAIELGLVIDRFPRICFVLMLPVGLQLTWQMEYLPVSPSVMGGIWAVSAGWLAVVLAVMGAHGTPRAAVLQRVERGFHALTLFALTVAAALLRGTAPGWLLGKLLAYAAICAFAILLEAAFAPALAAYTTIATEGSTPATEAALRRSMYWTYVWVIGIYLAVLVAGFLGTVKP
jgi:hypothetical protein